jgi:2-polyprenyl-6-hydroxyphenyl methylase/3-demethylubiquinone-9 3-methyltransferase
MNPTFEPICARETPCKCCGALAVRYGVVDFHKNCEIYRRDVLDLSGIPIYYHRCPVCQFIFTTAFDQFTHDDFRRFVYNEEYLLVDPDYLDVRPRSTAAFLSGLFSPAKPDRVLDYGGGNGKLAELLRQAGFGHVCTYDPFVPGHAQRPEGRFDCVLSFEVVEHSTDPAQSFADMNDALMEPGLIILSTLLQPPDIDRQGLSWWYAGPRNGHVSLFSRASVAKLVRRFGLKFASFGENTHVFYREVPDFASHFLRPQ